ncbi:helix-turn-helix domain-containing protein [Paraliobacillus sp. X-1268]|uniref:helix-turn-helix domain-containing protein n=1 Tax=Paraliobacillus sp. X-1268 TaxID=2213193 RepID=UPI001E42C2A8|nr:helix-turn-helix domain-containing protein [Paraliobacillus sp. X-1268]
MIDNHSNQQKNLENMEKREKGIKLIEQWLKEMDKLVVCSSEDKTNTNEIKQDFNYWDLLPDTLTALHISEYLHISRRRVYELFQLHEEEGGIPNFQIGASKRVDKQDFKKWITSKK